MENILSSTCISGSKYFYVMTSFGGLPRRVFTFEEWFVVYCTVYSRISKDVVILATYDLRPYFTKPNEKYRKYCVIILSKLKIFCNILWTLKTDIAQGCLGSTFNITSLTIGKVQPSVPFFLITITKPDNMVDTTSCVSLKSHFWSTRSHYP